MEIFLTIAGVLVGLIFCLGSVMAILPFYAGGGLFVNKPQGGNKSGFHLFTTIEPGQVKIIERGKKLVRMVIDTADKKFGRVGLINNPKYWELIKSDTPEDPIADVWLPIRWWARIVYNKTGLVFTGIYPFQTVREYSLTRTIIETVEGRGDNASNLQLRVKDDISDHFRIRQFLYPMHVTAAETLDKIPLDIIGVAEMEVRNPYKAAYGTDRWDVAVINLVTDRITEETKQMKLDEALTASNSNDSRRIAKSVESIDADEIESGIQITAFRIREINPVLDADGKKAIQSEAIATQKAKATRIDGSARADALKSINEANKVGGDAAIATMEAEALVRTAEAAGKNGGTVILSPGGGRGGTDPMQAAILAELKKLNRRS